MPKAWGAFNAAIKPLDLLIGILRTRMSLTSPAAGESPGVSRVNQTARGLEGLKAIGQVPGWAYLRVSIGEGCGSPFGPEALRSWRPTSKQEPVALGRATDHPQAASFQPF